MRTPLSDASTAVSALNVTANAAGTATGIENATASTVQSAREIQSEKERDVTAIATATGNATATVVTVSAVIDTDETKRIAIGRAGRSAKAAVELFSPWKTAFSLLVRDIAQLPLPMRHLGSEEDSVTKTPTAP